MKLIKPIVGETPLIKISSKIYAKLETYNPAGSVKDRMITYVVDKARMFGKINDNSILCDATSGNTGIALSMVAATYLKMRGEDLAAADLFTKGTAGFTGMMYPTFRDITEQLAGIRQQRGSGFGQPTPINPTEAAILRNMGVETSFNKERNQFYTTTTSAKILTMLPLVALNFTRVANDWKYRNPAAGEDLAEQMKWFALSQTRLVRAYPYNVYKEHERLQKIMSERAKIIEKKFEFDK